jgi:RNA polymerase sigma-B factor
VTLDPGGSPTDLDRFAAFRAAVDDDERRSLRNDLVRQHLALSVHLARRFTNKGISDDDLLQVAAVGLVNAVERFDPDRGVEFASFAAPTILGELKRHFRDRGWAVRIPRRLQELNLRLTTVADELSHQLGRSPTIAELAARSGASEEEVLEALDASRAYRSRPTGTGRDPETDEPELELGEDDLELLRSDGRLEVQRIFAALPRRDQLILHMRYYDEMTQQQIADRLGVSQMQISRLLARVLAQLRAELTDEPGS